MNGTHVERPAELWEEGCNSDEIRNNFVIPHLVEVVKRSRPASIADIGCGTGYISRQVARAISEPNIKWRLVDYEPQMLAFAASQTFMGSQVEYVLHDIVKDPKGVVLPSDLCFLAYTILDFPMTSSIAFNVANFVAEEGRLLVFMPDILEDVVEASKLDQSLINDYILGHCSLDKRDKFTLRNVLFEANRVEYVISLFLEAGISLSKLDRYKTTKNKVHYALEFRK